MRILIAICARVLIITGICLGSYSPEPKIVQVAGAGISTSTYATSFSVCNTSQDRLLIMDLNFSVHLANSTDSFPLYQIQLTGTNWSDCTDFKLHIYRRATNILTLKSSYTLTGLPSGPGILVHNLTSPVYVSDGDIIAFSYTASNAFGLCSHNANSISSYVAWENDDIPGNHDITTATRSGISYPLNFAAYIQQEVYQTEYISPGFLRTAERFYPLNSFESSTSQWLILEGVRVPNGKKLTISPYNITSVTALTGVFSIDVDFTNSSAPVIKKYPFGGGPAYWSYNLPQQASLDSYNIYINYASSDNSTEPMKTYVVNTTTGVGFGGLAGGAYPYTKDLIIKEIDSGLDTKVGNNVWTAVSLTSTNNASPARVGKIVHCRRPVVIIGDSHGTIMYGTWPTDFTANTPVGMYIGGYLPFAFGNQRYCMQFACGGNAVLTDGSVNKSIFTKVGLYPSSLTDCIFVFVDGPGTNDIITIDDDDTVRRQVTSRLCGYLGKMVSDFVKNGYDVVWCSLLPWPTATEKEQQTIAQVNSVLKMLAYQFQIPYVDLTNYSLGYFDESSHPDPAGSKWIASQIAAAYKANAESVPFICSVPIEGDLNGDCKVDFADIAIITSHWLDCNW